MLKKKTIQQKREARQEEKAKNPGQAKTAHPLDKLIASVNQKLGAGGRVFRGSEIEEMFTDRRSFGIPSLDYIMGGGLLKGGLHEMGGEYSVGKTTLALKACARAQREEPHKAIGWIALEPFSKAWARKNGLWIPFHPEHDPFEGATELELHRMAEAGIEDPYSTNGLAEVVLMEDERGDVILDATLDLLRSNLFSIIVVDSLGVAKLTKWVEEKDVQDASDFPREPKMLADYTTRAMLAFNRRYDENNNLAKDGKFPLQTSLIHLNQIMTAIGSQAFAPWKKFVMKGGEGMKHNHHIVMFFWKGQPIQEKIGTENVTFGQEVRCIAIKNKTAKPFRQSEFKFYFDDYATFR